MWEGGWLTPSAVTEWKMLYRHCEVPCSYFASLGSMLKTFFPSPISPSVSKLTSLYAYLHPFIYLGILYVTSHSLKDEQWAACWRALRLMRAFRWMAAASRKERRIAVIHTATRAHSVRETTGVLQWLLKQEIAQKMLKYSFCGTPLLVQFPTASSAKNSWLMDWRCWSPRRMNFCMLPGSTLWSSQTCKKSGCILNTIYFFLQMSLRSDEIIKFWVVVMLKLKYKLLGWDFFLFFEEVQTMPYQT